jgi:transcriptional regulator with XRE-family HTH domain
VLLPVIEPHSQEVVKTRLSQVPSKYRGRVEASLAALSALIRDHRKIMNFTQEELAESLGVAAMTIQFIEQGRRFPSLPMLVYICDRLGIDIRFDCPKAHPNADEEFEVKPLLAAEGDLFQRSKKSKSS